VLTRFNPTLPGDAITAAFDELIGDIGYVHRFAACELRVRREPERC